MADRETDKIWTNAQQQGYAIGGAITWTSTATPAADDLARAGWVRGLFDAGNPWYFTSNAVTTMAFAPTNSTVYLRREIGDGDFAVRVAITGLNQYVAAGITTQTFSQFNGPASFSFYCARVGGVGGPSVGLKPELYYSYDANGATLLGDWDVAGQTIVTSTNLYEYVVAFADPSITGSVYLVGRVKTTAISGSGMSLDIVGGPTYPSHMMLDTPSASTSGGGITTGYVAHVINGGHSSIAAKTGDVTRADSATGAVVTVTFPFLPLVIDSTNNNYRVWSGGGALGNTTNSGGAFNFVGPGLGHQLSVIAPNYGTYAGFGNVLLGGWYNTIGAKGGSDSVAGSSILGGGANSINQNQSYSTILGGINCTNRGGAAGYGNLNWGYNNLISGDWAIALGIGARNAHARTIVLSGYDATTTTTATNQMLVMYNVGIKTASPVCPLHINGMVSITGTSGTNFPFTAGGLSNSVQLAAVDAGTGTNLYHLWAADSYGNMTQLACEEDIYANQNAPYMVVRDRRTGTVTIRANENYVSWSNAQQRLLEESISQRQTWSNEYAAAVNPHLMYPLPALHTIADAPAIDPVLMTGILPDEPTEFARGIALPALTNGSPVYQVAVDENGDLITFQDHASPRDPAQVASNRNAALAYRRDLRQQTKTIRTNIVAAIDKTDVNIQDCIAIQPVATNQTSAAQQGQQIRDLAIELEQSNRRLKDALQELQNLRAMVRDLIKGSD